MFLVLDRDVPGIPDRFWAYVVLAGISQVVGTLALLKSFKLRNFAIGTVYSKAEVLIVAALAVAGLGTPLKTPGWIGAILVTAGVAWLASDGSLTTLLRRAGDPAALMGLVAGTGAGAAAIGIRAASNSLTGAPSFDRAVVTLTVMIAIQATMNLVWFAATDRSAIKATFAQWRPAIWVGVLSLLGSIGWAWAVTLESAAKVRALGQIELIIAFAIAHITLHERHARRDYLASATVLGGVVIVTVFG
jgi:drug/metabolite transporter (DMT)-like permease